MKRIIIFIILLFFSNLNMMPAQFKIGFNAGMNISNAVFNPKSESITLSSRTGLILGAIASIPLSKNIDIQPSINYIQKGFNYEYTIPDLNEKYNVTAKHNFISLPVAFRYTFMRKSDIRPFLSLAPDLGIKLSYTTEYNGEESNLDEDGKNFESMNFSLNFGGGFDFAFDPNQNVFLLVQYSLGITDLSKKHAGETTHQTNKLNGIQFIIGLIFDVK